MALNSLRAPYTAGGDYTFAGARLVMATGGNLLFKSNSNHTIDNLVLSGGRIHNGSNGNGLVTVGGTILVRAASEMYAQNGSLTINSVISGTSNLGLVAANGTVTFNGADTWTCNLTPESPFTPGAAGTFNFICGTPGTNNAITGTNAVIFASGRYPTGPRPAGHLAELDRSCPGPRTRSWNQRLASPTRQVSGRCRRAWRGSPVPQGGLT